MEWLKKQWHNFRVSFKWAKLFADHCMAQSRRKEIFQKCGINDPKLLDELWNRGNKLFSEKWELCRDKNGYLHILRKGA